MKRLTDRESYGHVQQRGFSGTLPGLAICSKEPLKDLTLTSLGANTQPSKENTEVFQENLAPAERFE